MIGTIGLPHRLIRSNRSSDSDQDIINSVRRRLDAAGYTALRKVQVDCDRGRIMLHGQVPTYFLKQIAQQVVLSSVTICEIDNDIRVTH